MCQLVASIAPNYRVAVGPLVGQGWERERPTLPRRCLESFNAVGVGLFSHWLVCLGMLTVMGVIRRI